MTDQKILVITERFYPENFIINDLVCSFRQKGFEVSILTQNPSYPLGKIFEGYKNHIFKKYIWKKITIYRFFTVLGYQKKIFFKLLNYFNFAFVSTVIAVFIGRKFDKVFIYQSGPLTLATAGIIIKKLYKKPVTIWTQDIWPDAVYNYGFRKSRYLDLFLDKFIRFIYANCKNIFVASRGFKDRISKYAADKKIHYFPNWPMFDCSPSEDAGIKLSDKFNFTFAGNVGKFQNLENVIKGFKVFAAKGEQAQLNIIGDGSHFKNLKNLVSNEKISDVVFWGRKKTAEMPAYFKATDALVISLNDTPTGRLTLPSKFQVYLTCGKPIFAVIAGETADLIKKYKLGVVSDPFDFASIAVGFKQMIEFARKENNFEIRTKTLLNNEFSKDKIIGRMLKIQEE